MRMNGASPSQEVPCIVVDVDDPQATLLALVENRVREALTPLEEAEVARVLVHDYGFTQEEVAGAIGRTQALVSRWLAVFKLDRRVLAALRDGRIEMRTAHALLPLKDDAAAQREVLAQVLEQGLSASQAAALVNARRFGRRAIKPARYTVVGAGRIDARTTRSGKLRVTLEANDRAGLAKLLTSAQKKYGRPT